MAGELDEVGLGEELAEPLAVSSLEASVARRHEQELLGRHLGRAEPEPLLEVEADDVRERRVVLLERPRRDELPTSELGERTRGDLLRRRRWRPRPGAARTVQRAMEDHGDRDREQDGAAEEPVRTPVDGDGLGRREVTDVGRVRVLREHALDRDADFLAGRLLLVLARRPVLDRRRLEEVLARAPADEPVPAREDRLPVAPGRGLDAEVDDLEVADPVGRLLDEDLGVRRRGHLDDVAEAGPDRHHVRLRARADLDRRVGRERGGEEQDKERGLLEAPHCRRSRMRKKRSSASVYGRSVCTTIASTSAARSMRSRSTRAAAACRANSSRTRLLPVSTTYRSPVSASSSSTSPTSGSAISRGSSNATAMTSWRREAMRSAWRALVSRKSETRKTTQRRFVTRARCSSAAGMSVPRPAGLIDRTSRMT